MPSRINYSDAERVGVEMNRTAGDVKNTLNGPTDWMSRSVRIPGSVRFAKDDCCTDSSEVFEI